MRPRIRYCLPVTAALALLPMLVLAQQRPSPPLVADPAQPVPALDYRSVFRDTALGVESESLDWRKANSDVGRFTRGHPDILKAEERDAVPAAAPTPASNPHKH